MFFTLGSFRKRVTNGCQRETNGLLGEWKRARAFDHAFQVYNFLHKARLKSDCEEKPKADLEDGMEKHFLSSISRRPTRAFYFLCWLF